MLEGNTMTSHLKCTRRLVAAAALSACAAAAHAAPQSIDLSTGAGWTLYQVDTVNQLAFSGPAFTYNCLGDAAGPQCLSVTSTGYAEGTWLPGTGADGFPGFWTAYVDFTLPVGAINAQLVYELLGVDDVAHLSISTKGNGLFVAMGVLGEPLPAGTLPLQGTLGAPGSYRLLLDVFNGANFNHDGQAVPIAFDDGTAVVGRFKVNYDLAGDPTPVPEPGTLACAGLALATALASRRRPPRGSVSRSFSGPR
jgi:PEP-CTERM motif